VTKPDYWAGSVPEPDDRPPATGAYADGMPLKATS